jgi:hypothetical protein
MPRADTFIGGSSALSETGLTQCQSLLGVGAEEIWTLVSVETEGCGYLRDRRPLILYERHIFHKETGGKFSAASPDISSPQTGGYIGGAAEYPRLQKAIALNREAAIRSTSWGMGQVMGFNAGLAGYASAEAMVAAMLDSEDAQLLAVANFLKSRKLDAKLAQHDWTGFARGYNGSQYAKNHYDTRLAAAFAGFSNGGLPNIRTRQAQMLLTFAGFNPGPVDGVIGKLTRSAVSQFRASKGLPVSDVINAALITALLDAQPKVKRAAGTN